MLLVRLLPVPLLEGLVVVLDFSLLLDVVGGFLLVNLFGGLFAPLLLLVLLLDLLLWLVARPF